MPPTSSLPSWIQEIIALYESGAVNQFILCGNIHDQFLISDSKEGTVSTGALSNLLNHVLLPRFDVRLEYDLGNGIRVEKGKELFSQWPALKENKEKSALPRAPRAAVESLTRYFRYTANLKKLGQPSPQVACLIHAAHLLVPALQGALNYDLNAIAMLLREWSHDDLLTSHSFASFLLVENSNDLHPMLVHNPQTAVIQIPLPEAPVLHTFFSTAKNKYPTVFKHFKNDLEHLSRDFRGATLSSILTFLKTREYEKKPFHPSDLLELKKNLLEKDCHGLIEFIEPQKNLSLLHGQEAMKKMLRQDFSLWKKNDLRALPMGYLICGPVGTGKTFTVECLAGEAGVPVVKIKNFRDKWVGSTEGNLEMIFRLLHSLEKCFVFIDEADQALGKRDSGNSDSGLSGRIYSMFAKEMSNSANRGKIIWVLASSRPDLIEVDLKRPGRIDVKLPLFPAHNAEQIFQLLQALCHSRDLELSDADAPEIKPLLPHLMTPGSAEALVVKVYRIHKTDALSVKDAFLQSLKNYQPPISQEIMDFQIALAVKESSDMAYVPDCFRNTSS